MKRTRLAKEKGSVPLERRRDWIMFVGFARMHVSVSGGPIHALHEEVLQLFIDPWMGDTESWTVYRHQSGALKDGKIVFKKWNGETDRARFRALGDEEAPKEWRSSPSVTERQIPVNGRWVRLLERKISSLRIPPIAGSIRPLSRRTSFRLRLWRSRQESEFQWQSKPPRAWQPITRVFDRLLLSFREHATGKPLPRADDF